MSEFKYPESFKGRYPGVFVLVILQLLNGAIHTIIGLCLVFAASGILVYSIYTLCYGVFNLIFAYWLWTGKTSGWLGTILVSLFVVIVDVCTVLDITLIAGVPKTAALGEIAYSLVVVAYLLHPKTVQVYKKND